MLGKELKLLWPSCGPLLHLLGNEPVLRLLGYGLVLRLLGYGQVNRQIRHVPEKPGVGPFLGKAARIIADVIGHALELPFAEKDIIHIPFFPSNFPAAGFEAAHHIAQGFRPPAAGKQGPFHEKQAVEVIGHHLAFKQFNHRPEFGDAPPA